MRFWRSVVVKLWYTILLLVSLVLFVVSIMLMEFLQNYSITQNENALRDRAEQIAEIVGKYDQKTALEISWQLINEVTSVSIIMGPNEYYSSPSVDDRVKLPVSYFFEDDQLSKVIQKQKVVKVITTYPKLKNTDSSRVIIIGVPFTKKNGQIGAVYIYQSVEVVEETVRETTKYILYAAGIALILTTFFAFFLSTRINAPLRKMKQAAFEVARGNFDTKVPIVTHDEIGELATAFNQMGRQLQFNLNALKQEKELLSSILSGMADGVITFNRDGTILITNPPAELFLQNWYFERKSQEKNAGAVPSKVMELFEQAVSTEEEQIGEILSQGRYWVMIVSPLYSQQTIRGAVAVMRDMTEERKLDKMRSDFIANVSHELRTPIALMQGYSEAIVDDIVQTDQEKKELAKIIYDESMRMSRLVNELLDLAKMESGHLHLSLDMIEIGPLLNKIKRKFKGLAKEKNITLSVICKNEHDSFLLDSDRIEQVLTNLIDNAIRHTPDQGSVTIIQEMDGHGLKLIVKDNGVGIPEDDLPFVFERFYKADKARTRGKSGTGLGLAIAKNIVEAHHGVITVQSKYGNGTTFSFFIPHEVKKN